MARKSLKKIGKELLNVNRIEEPKPAPIDTPTTQIPTRQAPETKIEKVNGGVNITPLDAARFGATTPEQLKAVQQGTAILGAREQAKALGGTGAEQAQFVNQTTIAEIQARQQQLNELLGQINLGGVGPETQQPTALSNIGEALPSIAAKGLTRGVTGAIGGAVAGAVGTGGVGSIPLAIGGALAGAASAVYGEIAEEYRQDAQVEFENFQGANRRFSAIINQVNNGGDPSEAIALFNREIAQINRTERNLRLLSEKDWLTKARPKLTEIEAFNRVMPASYRQRLIEAISNPDPSKIIPIEQETQELLQ